MTASPFLDIARQGRSAWWIYALGLSFILSAWLLIGSIFTVVVLLMFGGLQAIENLQSLPAEQMFLATNISFLPFIAATILIVWLAHGRSPKSLVTPFAHIDWQRIGLAFILWMLLAALISLIEFLIWPGTFRLTFEPGRYLAFLALPLFFTPIQIAAEELFFRGYLLQTLSLGTTNKIALVVLSGVLFLLPHLANPELYLGEDAFSSFVLTALFYFLFGALATWATLKDHTLEIALGAHAANNLYVGLFVNFEGSALTTPAIVTTTHYDPWFNLLSFATAAALFAMLMFGPFNKKQPITIG